MLHAAFGEEECRDAVALRLIGLAGGTDNAVGLVQHEHHEENKDDRRGDGYEAALPRAGREGERWAHQAFLSAMVIRCAIFCPLMESLSVSVITTKRTALALAVTAPLASR